MTDFTEFGRVFTAMVTPMREDGSVDLEQATALATALLENGSDGLVVCGTTGEASTLEFEEERSLFRALLPICRAHGAALVAGTGSNSTRTAIDSSRRAETIGVDGLLLVVPYYNKPSQEGMYRHFRTIAESVTLPCILYNVPSRTGISMSAATQLRLGRDVSNIQGTKEASGDLDLIGAIIDGAPDGFRVWSGNDGDTLPILALGGYGVVSVVSHLAGRQVRAMIDGFLAGRRDEAAAIHRRLQPLTNSLFLEGNPVPVKYALNQVGFRVGPTRLPLVEPGEAARAAIDAALANSQIDLPAPV
ncbi:MAG: 4-hydroxy-tetrahydrodipicolinate synthase [Chloroflexi bacterium]|nr:4-hydroxy-tetrahydrodipicolinate synthase [Chloroflexota bacterium]